MKKLIVSAIIFAFAGSVAMAQSTKELIKERKEMLKMSKDELSDKATKTARKAAKEMKKEGWQTAPGALPIEKQLDRVYAMQYEFGDDMLPKYIMGEAMSIGASYDAAKMQALELAKQNLAGQIQTEITALIENTVANEQMSSEEAESVTRSVMASKNLISQSIGRTLTVTEVYRTLKNKNKEVLVRIAYNSNMAKQIANKAIKANLEKKGDEMHDKLDKLMGM